MKIKITVLDKMIASIAPEAALKRAKSRYLLDKISALDNYTGEKTRRVLKNWSPSISDPNEELQQTLPTLRGRSRDLYETNPTARGAISENIINVIGPGLKLESRIKTKILGLEAEEAQAKQDEIEYRFDLWASGKESDSFQQRNFYSLQSQAATGMYADGDILALLKIISGDKNRRNQVSPLAIQLVGAHQLCNKNNAQDTDTIKSGVEIDKHGAPIAYHICNPEKYSYDGFMHGKWVRVSRYGGRSGRLNVVHLMPVDGRPGQIRGIPFLSPIIELLKQIGRYTEAELTAAVVSAYFTVFIKNDSGDLNDSPISAALDDTASLSNSSSDSPEYRMYPGQINSLRDGEDIVIANPNRPNTAFGEFVRSMFEQVGMGLGIPYEVLTRHFSSSYSASRAALLDAWKGFIFSRKWIAESFCQPIYEAWLEIEVLENRIELPGFLDDPIKRKAWCGAAWHGPSKGMIDPLKEAKSAIELIDNKLSTREKQAREIDGEDWYNTIERLSYEDKKIAELFTTTEEVENEQNEGGDDAQPNSRNNS